MPIWSKTRPPLGLSGEDKRNVIATDIGWVRRKYKGTRRQDEVLVPMRGLQTGMGEPTVVEAYWSSNTFSVLANTLAGTLTLVFDEPVAFGNAGNVSIAISNTSANGVSTLTANLNANSTTVTNANNTLRLSFTATAKYANTANLAGSVAITGGNTTVTGTSTSFTGNVANGEYLYVYGPNTVFQVQTVVNNTQLILATAPAANVASANVFKFVVNTAVYRLANNLVLTNSTATAVNLYSLNTGGESANLNIANAVSIAAGTFTVTY